MGRRLGILSRKKSSGFIYIGYYPNRKPEELDAQRESSLYPFYHSPRTFHQGKPAPIQMTMLTIDTNSPSFHQVF